MIPLTDNEKLNKFFKEVTRMNKFSVVTYEIIGGVQYKVYTIDGLIQVKISHGDTSRIINFDDTHRVEQHYKGAPKFIGPGSDMWDNETTDMFNEFIDGALQNLDTIESIFLF